MTALGRQLAPTAPRPWGIAVLAVLLFAAPIAVAQAAGAIGFPWLPVVIACTTAVVGFVIWPVRTLILFALFVLFIDTIRISAGADIKVSDEIVIPAMALITLVRRRAVIPSRLWLWREAAVVVLVLAGVASSLVNGIPLQIWLPGLVLMGKGIAVFYIVLMLDVKREDLRWGAMLVLVVGLVVLALGGIELVAPAAFASLGLEPAEARAGLPAIKSVFYHPQLFGWFCAVIALYLFAHQVVLRKPWLAVLGLAFSLGTILSGRRRAMIALVAALAGGVGLEVLKGRTDLRSRLIRWLPSTVGVAVLALAFLPAMVGLYTLTIDRYVVPNRPSGGGSSIPPEAADAPARIALYNGSLRIAGDNFPLGAGLGKFGSWVSRTTYSELYGEYGLSGVHGLSRRNPQFITDTFWPQVLGETGVVGVAAYGGFLAAVGLQLWRLTRRRDLPADVAAMALGAALVFGQTLVESVASAVFNSPPQVYLIMLGIGGVLAWTAAHDRDASRAGPSVASP